MKCNVLTYEQIDRNEWSKLVASSSTGTWFQTPEAFDFYASQPELFKPFAIGICNLKFETINAQSTLCAVCVGYVTKEKNPIKQFLTRRAIIIGGPCLADDCTNEEVELLMNGVRKMPILNPSLKGRTLNAPIYIECRNFNDYSRWKGAFEKAGFEYKKHLNFHVDTSSVEVVEANLGKSRKRDIRTTIREGVNIISIYDLGLQVDDLKRERMVHEYFVILSNLYKTRVKTPLFPEKFFQTLAKHPDARFLLTEYNGEIIGGTVCVVQQGKCLYEWFACGEDGVYPHVFPSCYATYAGIKYAAEHDMPRFDMMGAGTPDEAYGVRDFKAKFGGKEVEHGRFLCVTKPLLYKMGVLGVKLLKKLK